MPAPETPREKPQERRFERGQEAKEVTPISGELRSLSEVIGDPPEPLPDSLTEQKLTELELENVRDHKFQTFNEQFRTNEVVYRRGSLQRQAEFEDPEKRRKMNTPEFVVVNQAATYHEYYARVMNQVHDVLRRYERERAAAPNVSRTLEVQEGAARLYIRALDLALRERLAFANVLLIDGHLSQHFGNEQELLGLREQYLEQLQRMGAGVSLEALRRGKLQDKWHRGNALNQRIIDILSGEGEIAGIPGGFLPQTLYLDLLKERYEQALKQQEAMAQDPSLKRARKRFAELSERNAKAKQKAAEPLSGPEAKEFEALQRQIHDRNGEFDRLAGERHALTEDLLGFTQDLGRYQFNLAALAAIQHQFGNDFDLQGANPVRPDQTPDHVREAIKKNMELQKQFHLERTEVFLHRVEEEVLHVGFKEEVEDLWNKDGREALRRVSNRIAQFFTLPVPEAYGLRERAQQALSGPLNEAMGWPPGKRNLPFNQLTPDEQKEVMRRARSVLDAIEEFDRTTVQHYLETVTAARMMPPAEQFVGQDIHEPLPEERVTPQNLQEMVQRHGGPTVYAILFRQMDRDWGGKDPPTGFIGEYGKFFAKVNEVLDVHLDVGEALFQMTEIHVSLRNALLLLALLALGFGVLIGVGGTIVILRMTGRLGGAVLRSGARVTVKAGKAGIEGLRELAGRIAQGVESPPGAAPSSPAGGAASEVPAKLPSKAPLRVGRLLGHAGFVLTEATVGYELYQNVRLSQSMKALPEMELVEAAHEFWTGHPHMNREALPYVGEVRILEERRELIALREILRMAKPPELPQRTVLTDAARERLGAGFADWDGRLLMEEDRLRGKAQALDRQRTTINQATEQQNNKLKLLLPVDGVFTRSTRDPTGIIRFNVSELQEVREKGRRNERDLGLSAAPHLTEFFQRKGRRKGESVEEILQKTSPEQQASPSTPELQQQFRAYLEDLERFLEEHERHSREVEARNRFVEGAQL